MAAILSREKWVEQAPNLMWLLYVDSYPSDLKRISYSDATLSLQVPA